MGIELVILCSTPVACSVVFISYNTRLSDALAKRLVFEMEFFSSLFISKNSDHMNLKFVSRSLQYICGLIALHLNVI